MNIESIEQKIALRANENVQAKIKAFEAAIVSAMTALFAPEYCHFTFGQCAFADEEPHKGRKDLADHRNFAAVLRLAGHNKEGHQRLPWPSRLWEIERQTIRDDLMSKMDLMQKLLMTKPGATEGDAVPDAA